MIAPFVYLPEQYSTSYICHFSCRPLPPFLTPFISFLLTRCRVAAPPPFAHPLQFEDFFHHFFTEVSSTTTLCTSGFSLRTFFIIFYQLYLNSLIRGVEPRPNGCYSGALTIRLEVLPRLFPSSLEHFGQQQGRIAPL